VGQGPAIDELHGDEVDPTLASDSVHFDDVRVIQPARRPSLVVESLELSWLNQPGERQNLHGHPPAKGHLLGFVDNPHPAPTNLSHNPVIAKRPGHQSRGNCPTCLPVSGEAYYQFEDREQTVNSGGELRVLLSQGHRVEHLTGQGSSRQPVDKFSELA
jgi:hypothetical protein